MFSDVAKSYGDAVALHRFNLQIPGNRVTAIIGRSGSGKSTALKMINGLIRPERGDITVFGAQVPYDDLAGFRQKIGYAVQGTGLFPHLSIADNIELMAQLQGWESARIRTRREELMARVRLTADLCSRYPHELSGGQQQRAGLCRALMLNPPVLLLDEPFGALDPLTRLEVQSEFLDLQHSEPRTTVLVTHDMREAIRLADTIVIVEAGKILVQTSRDELIANNPGSDPDRLLLQLLERGI